jgi:PAS domain S-box-containing protein
MTLGAVTPVMWLTFAIQYAGRGKWLSRRNLTFLSLIPLLTIALVWTNGLHGLVWRQSMAPPTELSHFGPWFWVYMLFTYGLMAASVCLLIMVFNATPHFYSAQAVILLVGSITPLTWKSLTLFGAIPTSLPDLTPYLLILSSAVLFYGLLRHRLLDIVPLGREVFIRDVADAVIVTDIYHRVVDMNPAAERMSTQSAANVIGRSIASLFPAWPELLNWHQARGEGAKQLSLIDPGSGRYFDAHQSTITGRNGNVIGYLIVLLDTTERRTAENTLREQANYLNTLIESSGSAIIAFDLEGRVTSWNQAAEMTFGWSRDEVVGHVPPLLTDAAREELDTLIAELRNSGRTIQGVRMWWHRKDQKLIPVLTTLSSIRNAEGAITSILSVSTDMSRQNQLEQELMKQQRSLAILQERTWLARELHDTIGQVLSYVRMQAYAAHQQLSRGRHDEADAMLTRLVEVTQGAHAELRDQILGLNVRLPVSAKTADLIAALSSYFNAFGQNTRMQVEFSTDPNLPGVEIAADALPQVVRIVQEAATNASKYAAAQHLRVSLSVANGHVHGEIADDGQGFLVEAVRDSGARKFGLRIMAERAAEVGGRLSIESKPGQGTKVTFDIPCVRQYSGQATTPTGIEDSRTPTEVGELTH